MLEIGYIVLLILCVCISVFLGFGVGVLLTYNTAKKYALMSAEVKYFVAQRQKLELEIEILKKKWGI